MEAVDARTVASVPASRPAWTGHERGSAPYRGLLLGLFFAGVATFAQLYSPQAVLPLIARQLGVGADQSALVISVATIGLAAGVIPWSAVADRVGRIRAMSVSVLGATVVGLLVPFAPGFELVLTGRFLEGLLVGGVPAIAIAYLTEEVAPRSAARAAGTYVAGTTIGGLAGRLLAGPIAEFAGWRAGVLSVAVVCAGCAVVFLRLVPEPRGFQLRRPPRGAHPLARSLAANLRSPRQLALYLQGFLLMGGFVALYNYLGFRLDTAPFSLPQAVVSLIFLAYLAGTWSSARAGSLVERAGRLRVLLASIAVMAIGTLATLSGWLPLVLAGLVVATAGFFAAHATASGWTGVAAAGGRAQASSLYNFAYYAGSSVFGWLGGVFFVVAGWAATVAMVLALAVLAAVAGLVLLRARPGASVEKAGRRLSEAGRF